MGDRLEGLVAYLERPRLGVVGAVLVILLAVVGRGYLEFSFWQTDVEGRVVFDLSQALHLVPSVYTEFLAGLLVIVAVTRRSAVRAANAMLWGFWLIVLPPLIDRFVYGRTSQYEYVDPFRDDFLTFLTARAGFGLFWVLGAILALAALYLYARTRSPARTAAGTALILSLMVLMAVFPALLAALAFGPLERESLQVALGVSLVLLNLALAGGIAELRRPGILRAFSRSLPRFWMGVAAVLALAGAALRAEFLFTPTQTPGVLVLIAYEDLAFGAALALGAALAVACAHLLTQRALFLRDADASGDRLLGLRLLTPGQHRSLAVLLGLIAVGLAAVSGLAAAFTVLAAFSGLLLHRLLPPGAPRAEETRLALGAGWIFLSGYFATSTYWTTRLPGLALHLPGAVGMSATAVLGLLAVLALSFALSSFVRGRTGAEGTG